MACSETVVGLASMWADLRLHGNLWCRITLMARQLLEWDSAAFLQTDLRLAKGDTFRTSTAHESLNHSMLNKTDQA